MRVVSEKEFRKHITAVLERHDLNTFDAVVGPGRSGAIAAVYASHILNIPFISYGTYPDPETIKRILIVDTAKMSGRTLIKCTTKYFIYSPYALPIFNEPPRVKFWYEE